MTRVACLILAALALVSCGPNGEPPAERPEPGTSAGEAPGVAEPEQQPQAAETQEERAVSVPARSLDREASGGLDPGARYPAVGQLSADPAFWGRTLIVGSADGTITARSAPDTVEWTVRADDPVAAIAVAAASVVVAAGSRVEALSPVTGERLWQTDPLGARVVTRITLSPTAVYLGLENGELVSLVLDGGAVRWRYALGSVPVDRVAVGDGVVYTATESGVLVAVSASTGGYYWEYDLGAPMLAGPALEPGRIAIAGVDGRLAALDPAGVVTEWRIDAGPVLVAPVWYGEAVVVVDASGTMRLVEPGGRELWRFDLTAHLSGIPVRVGDAIVLGEAGGGLVSVDLRTGTQISRVSFASGLGGEAALREDSLWWTLRDGSVRAVGFDGEYREAPLFTAEGSWVLPETGTFRLEDERVSLNMRSDRDAVFEISVSSAPREDLMLRVVTDDRNEVATNMGKVTLGRTVRAALDAGVSYELIVSRPRPQGEITVSVETRQLQ